MLYKTQNVWKNTFSKNSQKKKPLSYDLNYSNSSSKFSSIFFVEEEKTENNKVVIK